MLWELSAGIARGLHVSALPRLGWPMCVLPIAPEEAQGSPLVQLSVRPDSETSVLRDHDVAGFRGGSTGYARSVAARMLTGCAVLCWLASSRD
jgi:hypothetical protein